MQLILNILYTSFIYTLLAISFKIIYNPSKIFHIAHAIIISLGAYFVFFFLKILTYELWFSLLLSVILSITLGLFFDLFVYRFLHKRKALPLSFLIASIGLYIILQNSISILWGDDVKSIRSGSIEIGHYFFGAYITTIQIITIAVSATSFIIILLFLKYSKTGRNIRALSSNSELVNISGINSNYLILWAFGIGSCLAAIAGILVGFDTGLSPTMGFKLFLYGFIVMILGGVGSKWGTLFGALLLAVAQQMTAYYIDSKWMDAIAYIILILYLIWKPLGFQGTRIKKIEI